MTNKDDFRRGDYGFLKLSDLVDRFMTHSFNNGRKYHKNMMVIAADAWKRLYWKTLRVTKNKRVRVDKATMTAKIPHDCLKVIGVRVRDFCGNSQPLTYSEYKDIHRTNYNGCGCTKCTCNSDVCSYLSGISYTTEDVELHGTIYQRVIKMKVLASGDLIQEISEPFAQKTAQGTVEVVFKTLNQHVSNLSVKSCGCVEPTEQNFKTCLDYGGCPVVCCPEDCNLDRRFNHDGQFKIDDTNCYVYMFNTAASYVEITYISNGEETASEIIIPEYCQEAMYALLYLGSIRFRQGVPSFEKRAARTDAAMEEQELYEFLNPIVPHEFLELQYSFSKW